jgi:hypothetical protein
MLTKCGKPLLWFDSITEACEAIGKTAKSISGISACAKGIRKSSFGYKWQYYDKWLLEQNKKEKID